VIKVDEDVLKKERRIKELESELAQLKEQMPAHSVKPTMLMRMEELEEELEQLKEKEESRINNLSN
jgi:hypothetical protein